MRFFIGARTQVRAMVVRFLRSRYMYFRAGVFGYVDGDRRPGDVTIGCRFFDDKHGPDIVPADCDPMSPGHLMLDASTLGQVYRRLDIVGEVHTAMACDGFYINGTRWSFVKDGLQQLVPQEVLFAAAYELHPVLAYAGKIPGVDPLVYSAWRVQMLAEYLLMSEDEVVDDVATCVHAIVDGLTIDCNMDLYVEAQARVAAMDLVERTHDASISDEERSGDRSEEDRRTD